MRQAQTIHNTEIAAISGVDKRLEALCELASMFCDSRVGLEEAADKTPLGDSMGFEEGTDGIDERKVVGLWVGDATLLGFTVVENKVGPGVEGAVMSEVGSMDGIDSASELETLGANVRKGEDIEGKDDKVILGTLDSPLLTTAVGLSVSDATEGILGTFDAPLLTPNVGLSVSDATEGILGTLDASVVEIIVGDTDILGAFVGPCEYAVTVGGK